MQRTVPLWLLFLVLHSKLISGSTLLRTAVISRGAPSELEWLSNSAHRRQLLGCHECSDPRWGPLCGTTQLLLQLADGYTSQEAERIASQLHADGAIISSSLPKDTWLVLAKIDALKPAAYQPHGLVPYSPQYKLAPEWHPVLEYVQQQQQQQHPVQDSMHHVQVHKRIIEHDLLERLQVTSTAQHLQQAAAAAADTALGQVLKQGTPGKVLVGVHFAEIPQDALQRLKVQAGSFHPAAAAVKDWQEQLTDVVMAAKRCQHHKQLCQPELTARSPWELDVAVCPQDLSEVLYWLSNQAVVHWLAPRPRLYLQNLAASANIQSSTMKTALDYRTPESHVFWNAGLDGKNQIVGIGDSGVDMHSCFFSDPQVPFVPPREQGMEWANPLHRKVVYYWGLGDDKYRDLVGHGTHTAGSIAGFNPAAPDSKATGAARSARLAFADLSKTAGGDVNAPQDLEANYFPKMYQRGACIFSDSWGSTSPIYDFQASKLDSWLYKNQDCISHFAAGNYGENDNLDSTITSPATAKNAVTVGATKSAMPNYISQTIAKVFMMSVEIKRANKPPQYVGVRLVKADFGGDGATLANKGLRVMRASPDTACSALEGAAAGAYVDAIVLARRGSCYFSEKLSAGAAAGAAAVVIINDKPGGYFKMDAQESRGAPNNIPLFAVTRRIGEQLWSFFENAESVAATIELYAQGWPAYEDIASFSSFGPTADGRIKPDIVAPGELVSAASADADGETAETCNVLRKSGTSMATPLVAGHTAIIRQYFMDGFYPTGVAGNAAHIPSGPLMKAIMLGGACDMQGNTEQYLPLEDSPSMRQGFGRFCLCNSLKLLGGADNCTTNVQLVDRVPIKSQESHKYCLHTTGTGDVRVTLVWYDFPAQPSAEKTLVNDLDLVVISGGMGGQSFFGNMDLKKDSLNTVERVWLRNVPPGGLEITVTAGMLSPLTESQNYSLVIQGAFTETLNSRYNPDASAGRTPAGCPVSALMAATVPAATPSLPAAAPAAVVVEKGVAAPATTTVASSAVAAAVITPGSVPPVAAPSPASTAPQAATAAPAAAATAAAPVATPAVAPVPATTTAPAAAPAAAPVDAVVPVAPAISPVATPAASPVAAPAAAAVDAAAAQAAAAVATPAAAPVAAPVVAQPVAAPAVAPAAVAAPVPSAASAVESLTTTAQANPGALVNALVVAMQSQAGAQTQSVPGSSGPAMRDPAAAAAAATAAQGRRLTWTPQSMQAWVKEQAPLFVCRWINASSCKAAAAEGQPVTGRSLKAHAGTQPAAALLSPVQQVVLGAVALLACFVLLSVGLRPSRIIRSVSLTSAVQQDQSLNTEQGRAPAGEAALRQALLNNPSLKDQLSPTKRAALGLPTSPFEACPGFSRPGSSSSSSAQEGSTGGGLGLTTPAHSVPETPHGAAASPATSLPLSFRRVQLGRHSAAGASLPVPYRPYSARAGALSASRSAPFPVMHSAPVSPVGTPLLGPSDSDSLSSHSVRICPGNGSAADLEALLAERPASRVSDSMLPLLGPAASPDSFTADAPMGLQRCSQSFTFGNAAAVPAASAPAELPGCEVFGLAGPSARTPHASGAAYTPEQLRSKSMQDHSVLHVQERAVLLAHCRLLSPEFTTAAAAAAAPSGRNSVDAVQPHDQRPSWQGRVSSP